MIYVALKQCILELSIVISMSIEFYIEFYRILSKHNALLLDDDDDVDEGDIIVPGNVPMDNDIVLEEFIKSNVYHVCYLWVY